MYFEKVEQYIWNRTKFNRKLGLHRVEYVLNHFGNPHSDLKIIHVSGTNGKGSVSTYIASVLIELGYRVGVYTSPHLLKLNERILLNGLPIDDERICKYVEKLVDVEKEMLKEFGECLSEFEVLTIIALLYYSFEKPDFVVLEVGLGGRFDATNICNPILSIITSISLDHQQFLGNTLEEIAYEKSGIIKRNIPVIIGKQTHDSVIKTILKKALEFNAKSYLVEEFSVVEMNLDGMCIDVKTPFSTEYFNLRSSLIGIYQAENLATSVSAIELLYREGYIKEPKDAILLGIHKAFILGRMQVIDKNPIVIIDGAHNQKGLSKLNESIIYLLENKILHDFIFVVGMMKDKTVENEVKNLSKLAKYTVFVPLKMDRGLSKTELIERYMREDNHIYFEDSVEAGVRMARELALENHIPVIVSGSLYLVGEVIDGYKKYSKE